MANIRPLCPFLFDRKEITLNNYLCGNLISDFSPHILTLDALVKKIFSC